MTLAIDAVEADRALKARHRAMWATGDYPAVATEVIPTLGPILVEAAGIRAGDRVLDIGAGAGNAAIPAALRGASVVAGDLTPELLDAGRTAAETAGVSIDWRQADCEVLPFADASFDAVVSCVGVMFAPHHQASADELVRVTRPGGRIGLLSWTPAGFIGRMFATMKPYVPRPPAGVQPPPLWGDEGHVRVLFGDRVTDVRVERRTLTVRRFSSGEEFRDFFKRTYGPTIVAYRSLGDDAERAAALDSALVELAEDFGLRDGRTSMEWEYLLLTAVRV